MTTSSNLITKEGLKRLNLELERLKNEERPKVISDIAEARSHGDLKENSEYVSAKEKQAYIEGRINELEQIIANADPFDPDLTPNKNEIRFGAKCLLISQDAGEEKSIQIVSPFEADLTKGLIAIDAPVAKELLGKSVGDVVKLMSKGKKVDFEVKKIDYES
jgi:transcription elongation factor GreA